MANLGSTKKSHQLRRLGILGAAQGPYVQQLIAAAQRHRSNIEIHLLSFADLAVGLADGTTTVTSQGTYPPDTWHGAAARASEHTIDVLTCDGLIVRTMPLGSLEQVIFRMDALQAVEHAGIPVLNPPRTLEIAIDKWLTLERLGRTGIPTPATLACQTRETAMLAFERFDRDVLVKPLFGGEGRGIVRVTDPDMAWRVFGTLQQLGSVIYVQQFVAHLGYDIRVLMIGERVLSIKRRAPEGAWRTNISQGCVAEAHQLTEDEEQLARAAARVTGGSLLGIDLLPARDGRTVVLEVNAVPGWKGTAAALGVDVAACVIEHLESLHAQRK